MIPDLPRFSHRHLLTQQSNHLQQRASTAARLIECVCDYAGGHFLSGNDPLMAIAKIEGNRFRTTATSLLQIEISLVLKF